MFLFAVSFRSLSTIFVACKFPTGIFGLEVYIVTEELDYKDMRLSRRFFKTDLLLVCLENLVYFYKLYATLWNIIFVWFGSAPSFQRL